MTESAVSESARSSRAAAAMADPSGAAIPAVPVTRWQRAVVREVQRMSPRLVSLRLAIDNRIQHLPGQHYVVRLTAEDGYTASRSYSIASAPDDELVELCIERLTDGEVSGYLYDVIEPGDELEVRGPIGGWFVWDCKIPAVAVGGGSGIVPIIAMARHARNLRLTGQLRIAASGRTSADLPYLDELLALGATVALTRQPDPSPPVVDHRLGEAELMPLLAGSERAYVCGSARFAESVSQELVQLGFEQSRIRVERFGPTG